jgi:hypothetical protein
LKLKNFLAVAGLVVLGAAAVHADSLGDGRLVIGGTPGGDPPPTCGSSQGTTDVNGGIDSVCEVGAGQLITSITFAIPDADTNGGLTIVSPLTSDFQGVLSFLDWTETGNCDGSSDNNPGGIDACTLNAPVLPTGEGVTELENLFTKLGLINDGDCDADDFIFGIPGAGEGGNSPTGNGCDISYNTNSDSANQLFVGDAPFDLATNNLPLQSLPEPSSLAMLLVGLAGIPFLRRRRLAE